MTLANNPRPQETPVQPELSSLLARYLQRQTEDHAAGLAVADPVGEVVPHEVGPVQPIDARPAWDAAVAAAAFYGPVDSRKLSAPPQWPQLVSAHEPATALPFCLGNFPQLVRSFQTLMQARTVAELRPSAGRAVAVPALIDWAHDSAAAKQFPRVLLALGALRLANQFDAADNLIKAVDSAVPSQWSAAWANEKAGLSWQRGRCEDALQLWQAMAPSVPVLFNRGMAELFCGDPEAARAALNEAVAQLPESSAWHHLGRLYLTLIGQS